MSTVQRNQAIQARAPGNLPPLGAHERVETGEQLQETLVELVDLALLGKQLHWSVAGPFFRPLHLQLDEMIDSWRELADSVAERAVSIGFMPDGQASRVATDSAVTGVEPGAIEDHRVVGTLTHQLAATVERVRRRMNRVAELDSPSEDVLVEVARKLEEQLWMIRVQQGSRSE